VRFEPTVSIISTCYNGAAFVAETIASVRAQTYDSWEHIIVDDGSTDDSLRVIKGLTYNDPRYVVLSQRNMGLPAARNVGFAACNQRSRYLLFLDADDCLEPTMLETLVGYMDHHPSLSLVYCGFDCIDSHGQPIPPDDPRVPHYLRLVPTWYGLRHLAATDAETPFLTIFGAWAGTLPSTALLRRSVYALTSGWDTSLRGASEDTDLFCRMALLGSVHFLDKTLVHYRRHPAQLTNRATSPNSLEQHFYAKWLSLEATLRSHSALVANAWHFRKSRVLPYYYFVFAKSHFGAGRRREASKCLLRAIRQFLLYWCQERRAIAVQFSVSQDDRLARTALHRN
jgi:glycosyltransferase involved in cell wall biosynthesis